MKKEQIKFTGDPETRFPIGSVIDGFMFKRAMCLPGGKGNAYEFEHVASGAHWLHCETEETQSKFLVAFRTPVEDDRGIPHILEHMVLSGSRKYPYEDMFDRLRNRTCIFNANATTTPEFTKYFFASAIEDEFFRVADCILDAVFNPRLEDTVFHREAWRYTSTGNRKGALAITGIVYNEVKADWRGNWLDRWLFDRLIPGASRSHWHGGRPSAILELSNRDVRNYHGKWYKSSNAYVVTQGPIPLEKIRGFLDGFFNSYKRQDVVFPEIRPIASSGECSFERFEVPEDKFRDANVGTRPHLMQSISVDDAVEKNGAEPTIKEVASWYVPYPIESREEQIVRFALNVLLSSENSVQDKGLQTRRARRRFAYRRRFANSGPFPFGYEMTGRGSECVCVWSWNKDDECPHQKLIEEIKGRISEAINDSNYVKRLVRVAQDKLKTNVVRAQQNVCDDDVLACWMFKGNPFIARLKHQAQLVLLEVLDRPDICLDILRETFLLNRCAVNVELVCGVGEDNEVVNAERRKIKGLSPSARKKVLALDEKIRNRQGIVPRGKDVKLPKTLIEDVPAGVWMPEHTVEEDPISRARIYRIGKEVGSSGYLGVYVDCGDLPLEQYVWLDVWTRFQLCTNSEDVVAVGFNGRDDEKRQSELTFKRLKDEDVLRGNVCDGLFAAHSLGAEVECAWLDSLFAILSTRDPLRFNALRETLRKGRCRRFAGDILANYLKNILPESKEGVNWDDIARDLINNASAAADKIHNPERWTFVLQTTDRLFEEYKRIIFDRCRAIRAEHYRHGEFCTIKAATSLEKEDSGIKIEFEENGRSEEPNVVMSVPIDAELLRRHELEIHLGSLILDATFARIEFRERGGAYGAMCRFNGEDHTLEFWARNVSDIGRVVNAVRKNLVPHVNDVFEWSRSGPSATIFKGAARELAIDQIRGAIVAYDDEQQSRFEHNVKRILLGATAEKIKREIVDLSNTHPEIVKGALLEVLERGLPNLRVKACATRAMLEDANKVLPGDCQFRLDRGDDDEPLISAEEFFKDV